MIKNIDYRIIIWPARPLNMVALVAKISARTATNGGYLVRFLDDPGPTKRPVPPARYTSTTGAARILGICKKKTFHV